MKDNEYLVKCGRFRGIVIIKNRIVLRTININFRRNYVNIWKVHF